MTFDEYFDAFQSFLKRNGNSEQTQETYKRQISQFFRFLSEYYPRITAPADIKREIVADYHDFLKEQQTESGKTLSNKTIHLKLSALKSFFHFLLKEDYIISDPTKSISMPKQEKRLPRTILTEEEVMAILQSCDTRTAVGSRNRAMLELLYACGMRTTELCQLKIADVDLQEQTVFIEKGKGNISRSVPIGQYAAHYIQEYVVKARKFFLKGKRSDPGFLFLTQFGNPFDRKTVNKFVMKPIQRRLQFKKNITVYSFRHSIATQLLRRSVDVAYIAKLLGHRSLNTTQQYLNIEIGDLKKIHSLYHPRER
jgi:integrase/recombinase XerD